MVLSNFAWFFYFVPFIFSGIVTAQHIKFSIKGFFSKCDQIRRKLPIGPHLLKKSSMENFIFCVVCIFTCYIHKQSSRDVLSKRCSENIQQIYRRTPVPKCDFNKTALQLYWNHTSTWVFYWIFAKSFQNTLY